jgi:hypothetical protein
VKKYPHEWVFVCFINHPLWSWSANSAAICSLQDFHSWHAQGQIYLHPWATEIWTVQQYQNMAQKYTFIGKYLKVKLQSILTLYALIPRSH